MKVLVGLGNPGARYSRSRHNAGFMLLDSLEASGLSAPYSCRFDSSWRQRFQAETADVSIFEGSSAPEKIILIKPQTFMNRSGAAVAELCSFFKIKPDDVFVAHDEIDLPFGTVRLRKGGGEGGHNGLRSLSESLGTKDYFRIRIGVGRPDALLSSDSDSNAGPTQSVTKERHDSVSDWVLSDFPPVQRDVLPTMLAEACQATASLILKGLAAAQRLHHAPTTQGREKPPRSSNSPKDSTETDPK